MIIYKKPTPYIIKGRPVKVYSEASSVTGNVINALPPETTVYAIGEDNGFIQLYEDGGFIYKNNNVVLDRQTIAQTTITERIQAIRKKKMRTASLAMPADPYEGKMFKVNSGVATDDYGNTIPSDLRNGRSMSYIRTESDGSITVQDNTNGNRYKIPASNLQVQVTYTGTEVDISSPEYDSENGGISSPSWVNAELYAKNTTNAAQAKETASTNAVNAAQGNAVTNTLSSVSEAMNKIGSIFSSSSLTTLIGYDHTNDNSLFTVNNMRSVFGMPYQFLPEVDNRLDGSLNYGTFGRKFSQKIISRAPILIMQAGDPVFLKGFSEEDKSGVIGELSQALNSLSGSRSAADNVANQAGKYYSFGDASTDYYNAVNDMCRSVAAMMGVGHRQISCNGVGPKPASNFNWSDAAAGSGGSHNFFGYYRQAVAFYVNAEPTMQDSFTNGSRQSQLASKVNQLSDQAAELQFILGGAEAATGLDVHRDQANVAKEAGKDAEKGTGILGTLMDRIDTLMSGGKLIFPEIWSDSQYTKNYNVTIKLDSPDCDPLSIYLNIFVPLCHIIGFCMPKWAAPNAYVSPFIVRAYMKSMFHVDMGLVTSCDITRGTQQGWTQDGLPTEVTVNLTIKDLYNVLSMITSEGMNDLVANPAQLDYLGNLCGINVAVPDWKRTLTLWAAIRNPSTALSDAILRRQSIIAGNINNAWQNLLNGYWGIYSK